MPELPAMENFRRAIEAHGVGRKIVSVSSMKDRVLWVPPRTLSSLENLTLREARRHGKYVFIRAGAGQNAIWLSFHCGMTGKFVFFEPGDDPDNLSKAKLSFQFAGESGMAFFDPRMFGRIEDAGDPDEFIKAHGLGPDAGSITEADFVTLMSGSKKPLKVFFLDQSLMAGIGNVYGDEIPFQARLSPKCKADTLTKADIKRLYRAMTAVLKKATDKGAYLDHWDMLPKSWLVHYREAGAPCPRCDGQVEAYTAGGRDGFWCPGCQA